jgi:hypothetical protein
MTPAILLCNCAAAAGIAGVGGKSSCRPAVRQAIAMLRAESLVDIEHGRGRSFGAGYRSSARPMTASPAATVTPARPPT